MARTTFRGPLQVGPGTLVGLTKLVRTLDLVPAASANTDLTLAMPRCRILRFSSFTRTAFTGTTVVLDLGTTAGGAELVNDAAIKAAGAIDGMTLVAGGIPSLYEFTGGTLFARIVQTGPTAVGLATLFVEYIPLDDVLAA
jgi:hypothetical protein